MLDRFVDRSLNYGRDVISTYSGLIAPVHNFLDLGAGEGADIKAVKSHHANAKAFAIEPFVEFKNKLIEMDVSVSSINLEYEVLPYADDFFDLCIANQVFEHLKEIFWVMHNVTRVLKVGGHLIIGVPNLASLHNRLLLLLGRQPTSIGNHSAHIRGYTVQDFQRLLELAFSNGYQLKEVKGGNFYPFPPALANTLSNYFPRSSVSIFLLLEKKREYNGEFLNYPVEARLNTNFYIGKSNKMWEFE